MSDCAYVDPAHPPAELGTDPGALPPAAPPGVDPSPARARRAVAAASFGTALEWYGFFLHGRLLRSCSRRCSSRPRTR